MVRNIFLSEGFSLAISLHNISSLIFLFNIVPSTSSLSQVSSSLPSGDHRCSFSPPDTKDPFSSSNRHYKK